MMEAWLSAIEATPPSAWWAPAPERSASASREMWKTGFSVAVLGASITGLVPLPVVLGGVALTAIPFRRAIKSLGDGRLNVDEKAITGESVPKDRLPATG
jgi:hypothetical protein